MKKIIALVLSVLMLAALCGCSLDYSEQADEGAFSFAYGKKSAFVSEYRWDGSEEGKTIIIPESFGGLKVVSVGGYFGRGLPMPFYVDCSGNLADGLKSLDPAVVNGADETVETVFTLVIPEGIEDVNLMYSEWSVFAEDENGKVFEYKYTISGGE